MPRARLILLQNAAQRAAFGLNWWLTCSAASPKPSLRERTCRQSSRTTESTPPERPTTTRVEDPRMSPIRSASRAGRSATELLLLDFLELAIADELLEAALEQLLEGHLTDLAQAVLQRLLQALHHGVVIAVRAAQRLRNDPVDQAERFQPGRRDAERLGRLRRVVRALPQDRRAALRGDHGIGRVLQHQD